MAKRLNIPLTMKVLLVLLAILLSLYLVTLWINQMATKSIYQEITKSLLSRDAFYIRSVETELERITLSLFEFVADNDLMELSITEATTDYYSWTGKIIAIQNRLKLLQASSSLIKDIKVFMPQIGRTLETKYFQASVPPLEYEALVQNNSEAAVIPIDDRLFISMRYPASTMNNRKPVFIIAVEIDRASLARGLQDVVTPEHGNSMLVHIADDWMVTNDRSAEAGRVLGLVRDTPQEEWQQGRVETVDIDGKQHLMSYRKMEGLDLALVAYVQEESLLGPLAAYTNWTRIILLLSVLITTMFAVSLYRMIHFPLRKLVRAFRRVEEGTLLPIEVEARRDEFNYLFIRFNNMVSRLDVLIHEVFERDVRNQLSELKSLQSQINPHFLYNCFFILNRLIQAQETDKAGKFSGYLGNYFRFITRNAEMEIPLELELQHAKAYVEIQMICYGDKIDVEFEEVDASEQQLLFPRFVIQPLLENAFHYAIEQRTAGQGELWVHCERRSNGLSIMVEDNGERLGDEELRTLQARLLAASADEVGETTGMINIHRRIQLMYGPSSGVFLTRSALGGLCAELRIVIGEGEEAADV